MSLHKFYKKKEDSEQQHKYTKVDLNSLPIDPHEIRRAYLQKGPFQPLNHKFPPFDFGGKPRRFIQSWFDDNKYWLEYSIKEDVAFCLCCYLFKSSIPNQGGSDNFVKSGFKAWNRKSGIDNHKEGTPHTIAVQICQSLMNQRQSITSAFEKQTTLQEKEYRTRLNASIDCVRFLLRKGLAFRGHNEKEDSDNKDESRDVSCKEQMALVLRFVNRKGEVVERFVSLRNVNDTSALSLKATIYDMLSKRNLSPSRIRGQGYDGASSMSGAFNGLKTLIMNETKSAHFLAPVFVAKSHTTINDFFDVVSRLLNIIGSSYKRRDKLRKKQSDKVMVALAEGELQSGTGLNQEVGIRRSSDIRWGSHFASLLNIQTIYAFICDVLEDLGEFDSDRDRRVEAIRFLMWLKSFDCVFCLPFMVNILGVTDHLNTIQQRKDQDIVNTLNQVDNLHHYQLDVFKEVIDMQLQEMNNRFNEVNTNLLLCIACLCPSQSFKAFDLEKIMKMATLYPEEFPTEYDLRVLEVEHGNYIKDVREDERFADLKSIGDLAKKMVEEKKHIIFPKIYLLVKLSLILPVFSAMKLIKTDIRNKMRDQFLSDSLVSYIEKNVLKGIGNDAIVNMFQDINKTS
uniref:TTF-type domain-containing protein n=1 Tax=Lactuca sativa TaxID=4236 RepID=A0A9R1W4P9_LACSA|nr:hypothetical protein LSAT_V11C300152970 [Lactuca sativa]